MRFDLPCGVLALVIGASAAQAQVITGPLWGQPVGTVAAPAIVAPKDFSPVIGADVPPMIELYMLPDDAVAGVPAAKLYKYTMVENKVVLVDPTKMRVVDVIGPLPSH